MALKFTTRKVGVSMAQARCDACYASQEPGGTLPCSACSWAKKCTVCGAFYTADETRKGCCGVLLTIASSIPNIVPNTTQKTPALLKAKKLAKKAEKREKDRELMLRLKSRSFGKSK
jgi:hypothetical protein